MLQAKKQLRQTATYPIQGEKEMKFLIDCMIVVILTISPSLFLLPISTSQVEKNITITTTSFHQTKKTAPSNKTTSSKKKTVNTTTNALHDERPRTENKSKQAALLLLILLCAVIVAGMLVVILPGKIIEYIKERALAWLEKKFG